MKIDRNQAELRKIHTVGFPSYDLSLSEKQNMYIMKVERRTTEVG